MLFELCLTEEQLESEAEEDRQLDAVFLPASQTRTSVLHISQDAALIPLPALCGCA